MLPEPISGTSSPEEILNMADNARSGQTGVQQPSELGLEQPLFNPHGSNIVFDFDI